MERTFFSARVRVSYCSARVLSVLALYAATVYSQSSRWIRTARIQQNEMLSSTMAMLTCTLVAGECPKCATNVATNKESGTPSCCFRGGSWFGKCGNPGDSKFDHTWFEGIQMCKSKLVSILSRVFVCLFFCLFVSLSLSLSLCVCVVDQYPHAHTRKNDTSHHDVNKPRMS